MNERDLRRDIVEICKRIYAHGWLAATDGNVSAKLDDARIVATPTGIHKGFMSEDELIVVDGRGKRISGTREPSTELRMHIAAYDARPDIRAVVHAHPTNCIAFSLAGMSLAQCLLPEIVFTFGSIPTTAYTTPTTEEVPNEIVRWVRDFDAMILDRHGSLTVGSDVFDAYNKLERMEHVAEITFRARQLGAIRPLSCEQITKLQQVGRGLGLPQRRILDSPCDACNACPGGKAPQQDSSTARPVAQDTHQQPDEEMVRRVTARVGEALLKSSIQTLTGGRASTLQPAIHRLV